MLPGTSQDNWTWSSAKFGFVYESISPNEPFLSPSTAVDATEKSTDFLKDSKWAQQAIKRFAKSQGQYVSLKTISKDAASMGRGAKVLSVYSGYERYNKCRGD
jgi:hypothetical protein